MLTEEERRDIEEELSHCAVKRSASIEALKIIQRHRGWVPDEGIRGAAELLGLSFEELENVATFYNMIFRKPVGRHVILVCDSVSCWIMDGVPLQEHLSSLLGISMGATTADNRFTLLPAVCLGACDRAPVMMVDEDLHIDLTQEKIDGILKKYT